MNEQGKGLFGDMKYLAEKEYAEILSRASNPHPTDLERVKDLIGVLGITFQMALRDCELVKKVASLQPLADERQKRYDAYCEIGSKLHAAQEHLKTLSEKWGNECATLAYQVSVADRVWHDALEANRIISDLKEQNPRIFGIKK